MFNADSFPKKPLNVQDLLKYNAPQKPQSSQVLRNLEKAKQTSVVQNSTTADDDSDDERIPRAAHKSQQILPAQKPTTPSTRKELVPILQKKNSEAFAATGHRLAKIEQQCRHQQEEIKAKSLLIEKLYKEASHNRKSHELEVSGLKTENNMLRNKIERMMKFMEKNNLEWNDDEGLWHKEKAYVDQPTPILNKGDENTRVQGRLPKEIDFKLIKKRIEDLNGLIEGEQDIVKGPAGAYQFRRRDPLKFIVYKDGLQIEGYPFYKYSHKDAQLVLEDILDGYFPYILREKFPEGTPFDLINEIDRTKEQFAQSGEKKPKTRALSESPEKRLRSDFNEKIQGVLNLAGERINDGTIEVQTQTLVKELPTLGPNHESIATLKIRTETGKRTVLVKALNSDTIEVIYKILREHSETQAFELWGGYPPQPYPNIDGIALQDLGVSGESVFNLRPTYA